MRINSLSLSPARPHLHLSFPSWWKGRRGSGLWLSEAPTEGARGQTLRSCLPSLFSRLELDACCIFIWILLTLLVPFRLLSLLSPWSLSFVGDFGIGILRCWTERNWDNKCVAPLVILQPSFGYEQVRQRSQSWTGKVPFASFKSKNEENGKGRNI